MPLSNLNRQFSCDLVSLLGKSTDLGDSSSSAEDGASHTRRRRRRTKGGAGWEFRVKRYVCAIAKAGSRPRRSILLGVCRADALLERVLEHSARRVPSGCASRTQIEGSEDPRFLQNCRQNANSGVQRSTFPTELQPECRLSLWRGWVERF